MTLVRGLTGMVHRSDCKVVGAIHKVLAPELQADEVEAFLIARGLENDRCRMCLRERDLTTRTSPYRAVNTEEEKV